MFPVILVGVLESERENEREVVVEKEGGVDQMTESVVDQEVGIETDEEVEVVTGSLERMPKKQLNQWKKK